MHTKFEIMNTVKQQLSLDYNCQLSDFEKTENTIVENKLIEGRRVYSTDGCFLKILCIKGKAIIHADKRLHDWLEKNILDKDASWLFDYDNLRMIDNKLREYDHEIEELYNFYVPKTYTDNVKANLMVKWYEEDDINQFKGDNRFSQAFGFESYPDVLGVAALDHDKIMGMAGASKDSRTLYQIGIDVLPEYRGRGLGVSLVKVITKEVLSRGKVPFYGTAMSHIISRNTAISAGYIPAWTELHTRKVESD